MKVSTLQQLKAQAKKLNSLIAKFPTVRSLVRKWGFELTVIEGQIEDIEAQQPESPKQLTIWDIKPVSNFEKLVNQFDGNKKAASYVLNAAQSYKNLEEVLSHFASRHHALIKEVVADEQKKQDDPSDKLDQLVGDLAKFEPIFKGSQKQAQWAGYIFARACREYAIAVLDGEMSQEQAEINLQNPDAKFWINNRKKFGYN